MDLKATIVNSFRSVSLPLDVGSVVWGNYRELFQIVNSFRSVSLPLDVRSVVWGNYRYPYMWEV